MAEMFSITSDTIRVNSDAFAFDRLVPTIEKALTVIMADHSRKYAAGQAPDGSAQKKYSRAYAIAKSSGGIRSRRGLGGSGANPGSSVPNLKVTGKLLDSRKVSSTGNEVVARFEGGHYSRFGSAAALASDLRRRGFKLHYLSQENQTLIRTRLVPEIEKLTRLAIKVEKT